jgi:hypothetical protein
VPGSSLIAPVAFVRTLQIIVAALTLGCVVFLTVALAVVGGPSSSSDPPIVTYIASAIAASLVLARIVVPPVLVAQARRQIRQGTSRGSAGNLPAVVTDSTKQAADAGKLVQVFLTRTVIAAAILEGGVFLLLVSYLVERSPASLGLAVILIVALAAHFPTVAGCSAWIQEQARLLDEERAF